MTGMRIATPASTDYVPRHAAGLTAVTEAPDQRERVPSAEQPGAPARLADDVAEESPIDTSHDYVTIKEPTKRFGRGRKSSGPASSGSA